MGSSKKQTVGYKYYLGAHLVFAHGPVDRWSRLTFDGERVAWEGEILQLTRREDTSPVNVSAPNLFGGDDIGKEGGVSGFVDFEPGEPDQTQNPYLQTQLGSEDIPAFRGVAGLVFRQFYFGASAYFKKVSARMTRINKTTDGAEQWYVAKAQIASDDEIYNIAEYDMGVLWEPFEAPVDTFHPATHTFGPFSNDVDVVAGKFDGTSSALADDLWYFNDVEALSGFTTYPAGTVLTTIPAGETLKVQIYNTQEGSPVGGFGHFWLRRIGPGDDDMNPAHIIRECLTDNLWGMGYNAADIDDVSFMAAADQLYDEFMGISILWDQSMPIEQFIQEIVKHIDAALYVDRTTGKFVLKLIRGGYTVSSLPLFDESNIEKLEDFQRPAFGELVNSVTVNYWDKFTGKPASLTVQDPALALMQGSTINTTVQYPGFTTQELASRAGQRDLRTLSNPLVSCTITAGKDAEDLNIGSLFRLDWDEYGIVNMPMRVTGIAFGDGVSHKVKMQVTQDVFALPEAGIIQPPDVTWEDPNTPPEASEYEIAIEMPYVELLQQMGLSALETTLAATPEIGYAGMSVSRPSGASINSKFMVDSGAGYEQVGLLQFTPIALLAAALPQEKGPTVIAIDGCIDIDVALENGAVGSWCQIGDELCIVEALSTSSITLGRGTLDTVPAPHADNSPIFFWDNFAQNDDEQYVLGEDLNLKALTVTGQGELAEADATARPLEIVARAIRPYPPADLVVDGSDYPTDVTFEFDISWVERNRVTQGDTLLDTNEATVTAEAGTTYTVRTYLDDVLIDTTSAITDLFLNDINLPGNGTARVEVWAVRDGYESFQPLWAEFDYIGAVEFISTDVPDGEEDVVFSFELQIQGGLAPYVFSVESGALPDGLSLDPDTGEITGTPTVADTFNYTLRVTDDNAQFDELIVEQIIEPGAVLWTPAAITTQLWFDAADAGTITISTGVSQWDDKSGNARHVVQATAANQPSHGVATLNGLDVVSFDGTDDALRSASSVAGLLQNIGAASLFILQNQTANPAGDATSDFSFAIGDGPNTNRRISLFVTPPNLETPSMRVGGTRADGGSFSQLGPGTGSGGPVKTAAINTWELVTIQLDYTNSDGFAYVNGTQIAASTSFSDAGNTSNTSAGSLNVGCDVIGTPQRMLGNIAEIVVTHSIQALERYLIQGYYAHKWGLEANLASFHPFVSNAPLLNVYPFWDHYTQTAGHIVVNNEAFSAARNSTNNNNFRSIRAPVGMGKSSGQWYIEYLIDVGPTVTGEMIIGLAQASMAANGFPGNDANGRGLQSRPTSTPLQYTNNASTAVNGTATNFVTNDVVAFTIDFTTSEIKAYVNNVLVHTWTGIPAGTWYPAAGLFNDTRKLTIQNTLTYSPPSGFSQWLAAY